MINYEVKLIPSKLAKEYIHEHHYSHGSHNGPSPCYGLYDGLELIGVCMFAIPCSERVRSKPFGKEYKSCVLELHRLHILDITPRNTESWFIARCLRYLKKDRPDIKCVVAFSDPTEGHTGVIYQATNALFYGRSLPRYFYIDENNRLRHPRQNGRNIYKREAQELGWERSKRGGKYRYLWLLDKKLKSKLKVEIFEYPKTHN